MSLPDFNKRGVLPKGLHKCTPKEFIEKFCYQPKKEHTRGSNFVRASYIPVLEQLFGHSIERGSRSIIFGGSFITDEEYPDDIDCIVILPNWNCVPQKNE